MAKNSSRKDKPSLLSTYGAATRGEPLRPAQETSRLHRMAHGIGRVSYRDIERQNNGIDQMWRHQMAVAVDEAVGPNKGAIKLLQTAIDIPHQSASYPGWAAVLIEDAKSRPIGGPYKPGDKLQWNNHFRFGASADTEKIRATALLGEAPTLVIDHIGAQSWSHSVRADLIHITYHAPYDDNLRPSAGYTDIFVHSNDDPSDGASAHLRFGVDGGLEHARVGNVSIRSLQHGTERVVSTNIEEVFAYLEQCAGQTVAAYQPTADL